ncbi:MAG: hypothetical protein SPJ55_13555 [Treponema sp.]|nr:hypothetical protein [Treponema sp.]
MAVSQKKKPSAPDISENIRYLDGTSENLHQDNNQIQTGAPFQNINNENTLQTPVIQKKAAIKDTQIIFRTTEENKNQLKGFFATYGITLSKGIQLACFYLEQQIKSGNVEINAAGLITKNIR